MTRAQIQCFLTVVEKMSITDAAKALYVSQPAVSRRITQLEEELGARLFSRDNVHLELTAAGRKAADLFREYDHRVEDLISEIKTQVDPGLLHGVVRVGVADGWDISSWFSQLTKKLKKEEPDIKLSLSCCSHEELIHMLDKKEVDMVLDQRELFTGINDIRIHPLKKMKCILMFSRKHPLAGQKDLTLKDFKDYVFYVAVSKKAEPFILDMLQACIREGFLPEIEHISSLSATYVKMLSENGVFFADEFLLAKDQELFDHIDLPLERTLCLGCRKNQSKICEAVAGVISDCGEDLFKK